MNQLEFQRNHLQIYQTTEILKNYLQFESNFPGLLSFQVPFYAISLPFLHQQIELLRYATKYNYEDSNTSKPSVRLCL